MAGHGGRSVDPQLCWKYQRARPGGLTAGSSRDTGKIVARADLPGLEQLWRAFGSEEHPGDGTAEGPAVREARRSQARSDHMDAHWFWIFAAEVEGRFVWYAAAARIPKVDARVGFLFVDELHVLAGHRNRGHATRIIEAAVAHAAKLRLSGVRLLVDPANPAARRLDARLGRAERDQILCQRRCRES